MKVSYNWLQTYFKDPLPEALALGELFTFHSFEIEGIEDYNNHNLSDKIIDAKILPDRAHYCLSHKGIAEEVRVLTGLKYSEKMHLGDTPSTLDVTIDNTIQKVEVKIQNEDFCRRYVARRIECISIKESDGEIKNFLEAIGGRAINSVVDAANFVMFDSGQPLHLFDANKVEGKIVVRAALTGEKIILLDGKEVDLTTHDFVIADDRGPLAIAGVKGGKRAEVTIDTKNIILEAANFDPVCVRKTSTKYNLRNESSKRFENEITSEWALSGMEQITSLIKELSSGAKIGPLVDMYPQPVAVITIVTTAEFINKKLGIEIKIEKMVEIFERLGLKGDIKGNTFNLTIPRHRLDLTLPEDIAEEVGRVYGYEKIEGVIQHPVSKNIPAHPGFYISEHIKNILTDLGFFEVYLYTFTNSGDIEVAHPLASDKKALRTNLSSGIEKALEMNARNADLLFLDSIKIFEIGKVFQKEGEYTSLCIGIKRIKKEKGKSSVDDIKHVRDHLLKELNLHVSIACTVDDTGGLILFDGKQIGITNHIDGIMELNLDILLPHIKVPPFESLGFVPSPKVVYQPFSTYPFIVRDIAVFVQGSVMPDMVEHIIIHNGTDLLIKHKLFDTFQKEGKVSYAFRLIFQSFDRTLTDEEIGVPMGIITTKMKERGWEVR